MNWKENIPADIKRIAFKGLAKDEKVVLHIPADIDERMKFGQRWIFVTTKRIVVYPAIRLDGAKPLEILMSEVKSAETKPVVGGGVLIVTTKTGAHQLLHFSNSMTEKFAEVAKGIKRLAKGEPAELPLEIPADRCPQCGRLLPDRHERCPFCIRYFQAMARIVSYLKPYVWQTIITVLITGIGTVTALVPPLITKRIIDIALPKADVPLLAKFVGALLLVSLSNAFLQIYGGRRLVKLGLRVGADIRAQVFEVVERLSMKFFDRRHVGQIRHRIMNDSSQLQFFLIDGFPYLAQYILMLIAILIILMTYSVKLTLLILLPVPIMFLGQFLFWKFVRGLNHKSWNQQARLETRLYESISGVRVVKAFSQEEKEMRRFNQQNERLFGAQVKVEQFWTVFFPGMSFFMSTGALFVWYFGGQQVIRTEMTLGTLMAFISYLWMFYGPLQWFSQINNWMTRAFAGAERIFETIDTTPETYDPPDAVPMPAIKGEIEFKDVTFSYEKGKPAIRDVSFKIKAGELIGLVGKSGSGKSTLLSLLCRFYAPDEGQILVDGVPIGKVRLNDLRRAIGLVLQDPFLFGSSIYENITYGRPELALEDAVRAARAANAHDFVMTKNDAYDSRVGERGNRLSGGEKQRISIARAILNNPRVLILDEATSSVDSETESKIQEALDRLVSNRTTLVAAHRLSTLRNADRIFVMDEGKLIESGPHAELMHKKGTYYKLVKAQEKMWRKAKKNMSLEMTPMQEMQAGKKPPAGGHDWDD